MLAGLAADGGGDEDGGLRVQGGAQAADGVDAQVGEVRVAGSEHVGAGLADDRLEALGDEEGGG